jgi:hypothetical protein
MSLTQLETVETELQRKRYGQNNVLKLTGLKRRSHGHQERLKRIKDGKDTAETRFRGFSVKKQASGAYLQDIRDLNVIMCKNSRVLV